MTEIKISDNFTGLGMVLVDEMARASSAFDIVDALLFLQRLSVKMGEYIMRKVFVIDTLNPSYQEKWFLITTEANAFIAKNLLNLSSELHTKIFTVHDHEKLTLYFHHLESDLHYINPEHPEAYKWIIRATNVQYHYQRLPSHIMGRYLLMFKNRESNYVNELCFGATGITFEEIMIIGICMFSLIRQNMSLNIDKLINHNIPYKKIQNTLIKDKIENFLKLYSISQEAFKTECNKWRLDSKIYPLYKYEFNPLWSFPIIRTKKNLEPDKQYIAPSLVDLLYASTEGIYFKLMDMFRDVGKKNLFSEKFGKVFQGYIKVLLLESIPKGQIHDEDDQTYNPYKADFLINGDNEQQRLLIEVKKGAMKNLAKAGINVELESYIRRITDAIYSQLFKKSLSANSKYHLMVSMEEWYFFEEKIKPLLIKKLDEIARNSNTDISQFKFHVFGCTDFEILCQFLNDRKDISIFDILKEKEAESSFYFMNINDFLKEKYSYKTTSIAIVENEYEKFWNFAEEKRTSTLSTEQIVD